MSFFFLREFLHSLASVVTCFSNFVNNREYIFSLFLCFFSPITLVSSQSLSFFSCRLRVSLHLYCRFPQISSLFSFAIFHFSFSLLFALRRYLHVSLCLCQNTQQASLFFSFLTCYRTFLIFSTSRVQQSISAIRIPTILKFSSLNYFFHSLAIIHVLSVPISSSLSLIPYTSFVIFFNYFCPYFFFLLSALQASFYFSFYSTTHHLLLVVRAHSLTLFLTHDPSPPFPLFLSRSLSFSIPHLLSPSSSQLAK